VKLFFKITKIETLINIRPTYIVRFFAQQMFLCFIINSFNDKTVVAMGAAILPNLLRFSMLRKPDVTSVVSKTLLRTFFTVNCCKLCVVSSILLAYAAEILCLTYILCLIV